MGYGVKYGIEHEIEQVEENCMWKRRLPLGTIAIDTRIQIRYAWG